MTVFLTVLSALLVLIFVGTLLVFLRRTVAALESIGGSPQSYLAKLGFGVRAIATETDHLAPQVTRLNEGLTALAGGLSAVEGHLTAVATALAPEATGPRGREEGGT